MTKKEILWREILHETVDNKKFEFTQKELAEKFGFSLSTVFNALRILRQSGAVKVTGRNFTVEDVEKFLYLWATQRNIEKEIIYETAVSAKPGEIEGMLPPEVVFGSFSAYVKKYNEAPADYDKIYAYAESKQLDEIKKRFPKVKGYSNLIILKSDPYLKNYGSVSPNAQTFADLWNLKDWYAKDFLEALKKKMIIQ